jgi:hypothetical protein
LEKCFAEYKDVKPVPMIMELAFLEADKRLAENKGDHSGCTVATALIILEETKSEDGKTCIQEVSYQRHL